MDTRRSFSVIALALGVAATTASARGGDRDLFAGQHTRVGDLAVCDDGVTLRVSFDLSAGAWSLDETHLYAGATPPSSPAPGRFPYQHLALSSPYDAYAIPLSDLGVVGDGERVWLAAHAVVSTIVGYEDPSYALPPDLPATVTLSARYPGVASYWDIALSDGGALDGDYGGWCVDTSRALFNDTPYTVMPISSYDTAATWYVDRPDNLDALNWLINAAVVGEASPGCDGAYTVSDVQRAIWTLIEDTNSTAGLTDWSECRVGELVAAALVEGEGYEPGCLDAMVVLLVPIDPDGTVVGQIVIAQVTVIDVDLACEPILAEETAWAAGDARFTRSWASYWSYEIGSTPCP